MKTTVLWDDAPCSLVEIYQCFGGAYCFCDQDDNGHDGGPNDAPLIYL